MDDRFKDWLLYLGLYSNLLYDEQCEYTMMSFKEFDELSEDMVRFKLNQLRKRLRCK